MLHCAVLYCTVLYYSVLQGPLQGHAEVGAPLHKRLSSSRSFDPTRSGKLEFPAGDVEMGEWLGQGFLVVLVCFGGWGWGEGCLHLL